MAEFDGQRATMYKDAFSEFPEARKSDWDLMHEYLKPRSGEVILEVGAGNGFFSGELAKSLMPGGKLIVSDPSEDQLSSAREAVGEEGNLEIIQAGADEIGLAENSIDAVWSFGAMHHVFKKEQSFRNFNKVLKPNGRIVIGDVFCDSSLARHFDAQVARYCVVGHEVAFWSDEYAKSLCFLTEFEDPEIFDFNARWKFNSEEEVGEFLYKLHAMTKTTAEECLKGAKEHLGINKEGGKYYLNWPMKFIVTRKL